MAGQNVNHYTRTDYINNNEILSITISEKIFEAKFLKLLLLTRKFNSTEIFQMSQRINTDPWQKVS